MEGDPDFKHCTFQVPGSNRRRLFLVEKRSKLRGGKRNYTTATSGTSLILLEEKAAVTHLWVRAHLGPFRCELSLALQDRLLPPAWQRLPPTPALSQYETRIEEAWVILSAGVELEVPTAEVAPSLLMRALPAGSSGDWFEVLSSAVVRGRFTVSAACDPAV